MNDNIPAIDAWCNPFTELGIRSIFTENPEVAQVMGDQWGRHDNMHWYTSDEFIAYMDSNNVERVCVPSLKMMRYRTREMLSDIPHEHIAELVAAHPDRMSSPLCRPWRPLWPRREFLRQRRHGPRPWQECADHPSLAFAVRSEQREGIAVPPRTSASIARAHCGTFEACFSNPTLPAIKAGAAKRKTCQKGKFHGITARIAPSG